jgi:hypothetical protein
LKRSVTGCGKGRMKKRIRIMQPFSKEGIMFNKSQRGMNVEDVYLQENLLPLGIKKASIIVKETIKEKLMINEGMNSKLLHHKEDHFLPGIKVCFLVIVLLVINLSIKL